MPHDARRIRTKQIVFQVRLMRADHDQVRARAFRGFEDLLIGAASCHHMTDLGVALFPQRGGAEGDQLFMSLFNHLFVVVGLEETADETFAIVGVKLS